MIYLFELIKTRSVISKFSLIFGKVFYTATKRDNLKYGVATRVYSTKTIGKTVKFQILKRRIRLLLMITIIYSTTTLLIYICFPCVDGES